MLTLAFSVPRSITISKLIEHFTKLFPGINYGRVDPCQVGLGPRWLEGRVRLITLEHNSCTVPVPIDRTLNLTFSIQHIVINFFSFLLSINFTKNVFKKHWYIGYVRTLLNCYIIAKTSNRNIDYFVWQINWVIYRSFSNRYN